MHDSSKHKRGSVRLLSAYLGELNERLVGDSVLPDEHALLLSLLVQQGSLRVVCTAAQPRVVLFVCRS